MAHAALARLLLCRASTVIDRPVWYLAANGRECRIGHYHVQLAPGNDGAQVEFRTQDGETHPAVLHRLKHCFGRGLLLYSAPVDFKEKDVIELRLEIDQ